MFRSAVLFFFVAGTWSLEYVEVASPKGSFRGQTHEFNVEAAQHSADVFYGIPYAKPPVGPLRFLPPQPAEPRTEVRYTIEKPNACLQMSVRETYATQFEQVLKYEVKDHKLDEDCLYLNIYRPSGLPADDRLSVMVWIHGGGFIEGSSSLQMYDGRYLAALKNVIVVAINYRLGPLGFAYLGDDTAPGNVGLLDQRLALQWVKENIASFGGDPESVTIFGNSAGGASVEAHIRTPGSAGLFKRAIIQSGVMSNPWASRSQEKAKQNTLKLAELFGCEVSTSSAATTCLREKPGMDLVRMATFNVTTGKFARLPFGPVINDGAFFTETQATDNAADILIGVAKNEGAVFMPIFMPHIYSMTNSSAGHSIEQFDATLSMMFPKTWRAVAYEYLGKSIQKSNQNPAGESVCSTQGITPMYRDLPAEIFGDFFLTCGCIEEAKNLAALGKRVYVYEFREYVESTDPAWMRRSHGQVSVRLDKLTGKRVCVYKFREYVESTDPAWMRRSHGQELEYIFGAPLAEPRRYAFKDGRMAGTHLRIAKDVMEMWTGFAKTGNPTAHISMNWPVGPDQYMKIEGEGKHGVERGLRSEMCAYWKETH